MVEDVFQPMYNLTVDDVHTFAVGEGAWVVHNSNRSPNPVTKPISAMDTNVAIATQNNYRDVLSRFWTAPGTNWEAHHIVAWNHQRAQPARDILTSVGIGHHQPANLVWLPKNKSIIKMLTNLILPRPRAHHGAGTHSYATIDAVNVRINDAYINAGGSGAPIRDTRQAVLRELYNIANEYLMDC